MSGATIDEAASASPDAAAEPHLGWAVAGMSAGAAVIHFAMTPLHAASGWEEPFLFAFAGWFQLVTAAMILAGRGSKKLYVAIVVANAAFIGAWVYSRTIGLPFGEDPNVAEDVGAIDASAVALQIGVIAVSLRLLLAPERRTIGRLAPAMAAVAALGLATTVITSSDAASHGDHASSAAAELTGMAKLQAEVDDERCDTGFNIPAYWEEAEYLGIDTRWGGKPPAVADAAPMAGGDHHGGASATGATPTTTEPDPLEGRGSPGLDDLVSATFLAATSEVEAASFVAQLSDATQADYDAWLWWLRSSGSLAHEHAATFTEEDGSGHGGHVGPQPWVAMTDQAQCDQLEEELDLARATALTYPTAQDAMDAGYQLVAPYLPGIASHFIKYDLIDGEFEIDRPEMILYDGNTGDARVVGLSYYLRHPGDNKPTQGFTGDNDSSHRHIGLCSAPGGGVIGDSTTTAEDCEARGGSKSDGSAGWMSHAWVVPGCESAWGVFSAASPTLDDDLGEASGSDGGHCAGSGVRERYGMGEPDVGDGETAAAPDEAPTDTVDN